MHSSSSKHGTGPVLSPLDDELLVPVSLVPLPDSELPEGKPLDDEPPDAAGAEES